MYARVEVDLGLDSEFLLDVSRAGAKLELLAGGAIQRRQVMPTRSYQSQSELVVTLAIIVLVVMFLAAPAAAQQIDLVFDPERTVIEFTLDATMHTVHGAR